MVVTDTDDGGLLIGRAPHGVGLRELDLEAFDLGAGGAVVDAGFQGDDAEEIELLRMEDTRMSYGG